MTYSEVEKKKNGDVSRKASAIPIVEANSPKIVGRIVCLKSCKLLQMMMSLEIRD